MREYIPKRELIVTDHANARIKERMGLSKSAAGRIAKIAWEKGLKHSDCTGKLEVLLTAIFMKHKTANNLRVYAQKVFVFADGKLITVLPLHAQFRKLAEKLLKRKTA